MGPQTAIGAAATVSLACEVRSPAFRAGGARVMGFADVYNLFNTNAAQTLTTSPGGAWLRPTVITEPRILRIGARLEW